MSCITALLQGGGSVTYCIGLMTFNESHEMQVRRARQDVANIKTEIRDTPPTKKRKLEVLNMGLIMAEEALNELTCLTEAKETAS